MNKIYFLIISLFVVAIVTVAMISVRHKTTSVTIGDKKYTVELAQTNSEREKGLSNRESLDIDKGMLFVFPYADIWSFWMKDTKIPLDIIWLNDNIIVEMTTLGGAPTYTPQNKADHVLELNAGEIKKNNFKVGDEVKIK